jgi:MarR family transcriptional regulator, organic hydroperoxide resistance regulator
VPSQEDEGLPALGEVAEADGPPERPEMGPRRHRVDAIRIHTKVKTLYYRAAATGGPESAGRRGRIREGRTGLGEAAPPSLGARAAPGSLGRTLDFMRLLWAVDHGLTRISRKMQRTKGVTGPQRLVVRVVGRRPGISAGELAQTLHLHPSTLTEVLRRLGERGFLERTSDPGDARRLMFRLTRKGRALDASRSGTVEARVRVALASLSAPDLAAATRVLARIASVLSPEP